MAKKKQDKKNNVEEKEYIIPLREKCRVVPRYKKTNKAVKTIKEFLVRHMKIRDRDLNKIKLDTYLNQFLWRRGIKNPPHKVKVKASLNSNGTVSAKLVELPKKLKDKKAREEKINKVAKESASKKPKKSQDMNKSLKEARKKEDSEKKESEKETKEKKAAVAEEAKKMSKKKHKQAKHQSKKQVKSAPSQKQNLSR